MRAPYPALVALLVVDRLVERPSIDMLLEATPAPASSVERQHRGDKAY